MASGLTPAARAATNKPLDEPAPLRRSAALIEGFEPPSSNATYMLNQLFEVVIPSSRSVATVRLVAHVAVQALAWTDREGQYQEPRVKVPYRELIEAAGLSRAQIAGAIAEARAQRYIRQAVSGRPDTSGRRARTAELELRWDESGAYAKTAAEFKGFYVGEGRRTWTPNDFLYVVVPNEPLNVIKVVAVILRNTIGWSYKAGHRRQQVQLGYRDLHRLTGIASPARLTEALSRAIAGNYIEQVRAGCFDRAGGAASAAATYGVKWRDAGESGAERTGSKTVAGPTEGTGSNSVAATGSKTVAEAVQKR